MYIDAYSYLSWRGPWFPPPSYKVEIIALINVVIFCLCCVDFLFHKLVEARKYAVQRNLVCASCKRPQKLDFAVFSGSSPASVSL